MKIASQIQNTHPWPGSVALSGKTQGGLSDEGREKTRKEGREHEAETQGVKRQTVDSRGLYEGSRKGWRARRKGMKGGGEGGRDKKGGIQGAYEGGKGSGPFPPWRTREGEKKGNAGGKEMASERASARSKERRTPTSKKITIFAYVNYRLTRMNDRPRYFRPPVDSHQIDCLG